MEPWNYPWADQSQSTGNSQIEPWNILMAEISQDTAKTLFFGRFKVAIAK